MASLWRAVRRCRGIGGARGLVAEGAAASAAAPAASTRSFGSTWRGTGAPPVPAAPLWGAAQQHGSHASGVGAAKLDWQELGFDYVPTNGHVVHTWKNGSWDLGRFVEEPYINIHILANSLHYGQSLFEGFKVYHTKSGGVQSFVSDKSHARMTHGCRRFQMQAPSWEMFSNATSEVVRQNAAFLPPYGTGGALYMRPFIFGSGPKLGLGPSPEYTFIVFSNPVGSYYRTGQMQALDALVNDDYDRAAPLGCGDCKAAGNYAADLESMVEAKKKGFPISLYLDGRERKYIEEFNTSNFICITKDKKFITPHSPRTVLASTTNSAIRQLATDMGLPVEQRNIDFEAEVDNFAEVGAVGTAVVVTPIKSLTRGDRVWKFKDPPEIVKELHDTVRGIQQGDIEDKHGFCKQIDIVDKYQRPLQSIYPPM